MNAMKFDLTLSIVLFKTNAETLTAALRSVAICSLNYKLYLIDNSPTDELKKYVNDPRVEYIFTGENMGFGRAHNIALRRALRESKYHVVMNPDVYFNAGTLEKLSQYMDGHRDVGLMMPKVLNPQGEVQYLCKRLPSPLGLFFRRFIPGSVTWIRKVLDEYEMREMDYNSEFQAPYLSGCFMFLNLDAIEEVGFFDERFFLYMEDIDLSRRICLQYKNVYYPRVKMEENPIRH